MTAIHTQNMCIRVLITFDKALISAPYVYAKFMVNVDKKNHLCKQYFVSIVTKSQYLNGGVLCKSVAVMD